MQHMKYDAHLRALENQVSGLLHRVGGYAEGEYEFLPIQGMERPWQMRNKAVYRAGGTAKQPYLGFVGRGTHEVIPAADCLLQTEEAHMAARTVQNWMAEYAVAPYDERSRRGILRHLIVRTGKKGETMVVPVTAGAQLPHAKELVDALQKALPGLRSVVQNVNSRATQEILGRQCVTLWGEDRLEDELHAEAVGDFLGQIDVKADVFAVFIDKAHRRVFLVKAHHEGALRLDIRKAGIFRQRGGEAEGEDGGQQSGKHLFHKGLLLSE